MIISDLSYLEVVAEASSVVGGSVAKALNLPKIKFVVPLIVIPTTTTIQKNAAEINQNAEAVSAATTKKGDATSQANAVNNLDFAQANVGS